MRTEKDVAEGILSETEWSPAVAAVGDQIARAIADTIKDLAEKQPDAIAKAIAVVVPAGPGKTVFVLADPATQDIADELKRLADQGEESPLGALAAARIPLTP